MDSRKAAAPQHSAVVQIFWCCRPSLLPLSARCYQTDHLGTYINIHYINAQPIRATHSTSYHVAESHILACPEADSLVEDTPVVDSLVVGTHNLEAFGHQVEAYVGAGGSCRVAGRHMAAAYRSPLADDHSMTRT